MALGALRHRNFQLFVGGQSISLVGTWMQSVALGWVVLELTNSPFQVGLVSTLGALPSPTWNGELVSSSTTHPSATDCIQVPTREMDCPPTNS